MTLGPLRWWVVAPLSVVAAGALAAAWYGMHVVPLRRGAALFHGRLPLVARVTGQPEALPTIASRCVNCHSPAKDPVTSTASFAPALDEDSLTQPHSRRGGPAARYNERTFCALLRSGVDPVYVMVPQEMPRYELSNDDCGSLWRYVASR